jgi:predicted DNA-binding transcriptional regulator AlpA
LFHERSEDCEAAMERLRKKKRRIRRTASGMVAGLTTVSSDSSDLIPGPKLRAKLGISAVTLWRWRHDPEAGFPPPKLINGRLYFLSDAVAAWLANQPEVA